MLTPPDNHWTRGSFSEFQLFCLPEIDPPNRTDDLPYHANYRHNLGFIHISLGGRDATGHLPSTHVFLTLMSFAGTIVKLFQGQSISFISTTEPFIYRVSGDRERKTITLHYGWDGRDEPFIDGAVISMRTYFREVIRACEKWLAWIEQHYYDEITSDRLGEDYRAIHAYLAVARLCVAQLEADDEREARLKHTRRNGGAGTSVGPASESSKQDDHPAWEAIRSKLGAAQADGKSVTLDIQAQTLTFADDRVVVVDAHYAINDQSFTHTFFENPERLLEFLGVADAPTDLLLVMLRQFVQRGIGDVEGWQDASLFAEINESGHGVTYGRYTAATGERVPFPTDFAVYALFSVIRRRYSRQQWRSARLDVTPFMELNFMEEPS